jgi:DMSO/TMAO reductase YedYZ molybdopterin-dependent catalytic subunit
MSRSPLFTAGLLAIAVVANAAAAAEAPGGVDLAGQVEHALHLTLAALQAMPQSTVDVTFQTDHGTRSGHYTGALLWEVVQKAGIAEPAESKAKHHLQHSVIVTGRDGYQVAVAMAEIDPEFEGKTVILTDDQDIVRLVVPGDKLGGRAVRDVVKIEIE